MQNIKKDIYSIQQQIKQLKYDLLKNNIDMNIFLDDIIECLSFISGYAEKSLEKNNNQTEATAIATHGRQSNDIAVAMILQRNVIAARRRQWWGKIFD